MSAQPGSTDGHDAGLWWRPALAMFAVGYGANQFVPLLSVYRRTLRLSDAQATAVFGVYALGLIPGLLLGGRASDRYGRRPLMLAFAALSLVATAVLITGQWGPGGLYAGRLLTGVVSGTVFTVGTAWVKELSTGAAPGTGARRAAVALTAGFGIGPLVAGPLAQWAPAPEVFPYLVHLVLAATALALLPGAPETRRPGPAPGRRSRLLAASACSPRFRRLVLPLGPWVFGSVTIVFTTLPAHGVQPLPALGVAFPGLLAAASLAAGFAVQPWGRRLHARSAEHGGPGAASIALAVETAGCLAAAEATASPGLLAVTVAALLLGAGYGLCLIIGLREVEQLAAPDELGAVVAVFYSLAYSGLAVPYLLALIAPHIGYPPGAAWHRRRGRPDPAHRAAPNRTPPDVIVTARAAARRSGTARWSGHRTDDGQRPGVRRQRGQRHRQHLLLIRGGVAAGLAGPQHPGQRLPTEDVGPV